MARKPNASNQPEPFEARIEKLEELIDRIESGEIGLEESISAYEQGIEIIEGCRSMLESAEQRVDELTSRLAGKPDEADQA